MPYTDEQLMARLQSHPDPSMEGLVDRYRGKLFNYFFRMSGDRDLSSDLVQNTFIRLYEYRDRYQPDRPLFAWLFGIARNVWNSSYQKSAKRMEILSMEPLERHPGNGYEPGHDYEDQDLVAKALLELPEKDRELVVLYHLKGFSYQELAPVFEQRPETLRVAVFRALKKLGIILNRLGYEHT